MWCWYCLIAVIKQQHITSINIILKRVNASHTEAATLTNSRLLKYVEQNHSVQCPVLGMATNVMVRALASKTMSVCRTSLECWVPYTNVWKILKKTTFTRTSYKSYNQEWSWPLYGIVFIACWSSKIAVMLDSPLYSITCRTGEVLRAAGHHTNNSH
jgi:hypothetical protein